MKKQDNYLAMPIVHQQVAGVDIGSPFHVVAIGDDPKQSVQQFGVSTKELFRLAQWLTDHQVRHVAMEATGGYQRPLVNVLQEVGFEVLVTAGANTKNYRRFKSDTSDAIHIRTLHSLGLLPPIFLPDEFSTAPAAHPHPATGAAAEKSGGRCRRLHPAPADRAYPESPTGGQCTAASAVRWIRC